MYNRLVLFDIDKTLVYSTAGHKEAFEEAFRRVYGVEATVDFSKQNGITDQTVVQLLMSEAGLTDAEIFAKMPECMRVMNEYYLAHSMEHVVTPMPGVLDLLSALDRQGALMGLVTGNLEAIARAKMRQIGANDYFKVGGFGSDHIERTQLVGIAIKQAESNYGFVRADNVFLVGDTPNDILAGKEAGVKTIGVAAGINSSTDLTTAGATFVLNSLADNEAFLAIVQ